MRIILATSIILSLLNCSTPGNPTAQSTPTKEHHLSFAAEKRPKAIKANSLEDIFHIKKVVKLKTSENSILGQINKVVVSRDGNNLFIGDFNSTASIYHFDINGKFLKKIGKKGSGPGEYKRLIDFATNQEDEYFLLSDYKIIKYAPDGTFVDEIQIPFLAYEAASSGDQILIRARSLPKKRPGGDIFIYDSNLNLKKEINRQDLRLQKYMYTPINSIASGPDGTFYFSDIYECSVNTSINKGITQLNIRKQSDEYHQAWDQTPLKEKDRQIIKSELWRFKMIHSFNCNLLLWETCRSQNISRFLLLNTKQKKTISFHSQILGNTDTNPKEKLSVSHIAGTSKNELIGVISDSETFKIFKPNYKEFKDIEYNIDDNQILVFLQDKETIWNTAPM